MVIDLGRIVRPAEPEWLTRELRPPRKRLRPETLRQELQAIIAAQEEPPPSLRVVAERLGHSVPALRRHCPDLCETLVRRYTEYIQTEKQQRLETRAREIREAVLSLQSAGVYPSQERVAALLTRPAFFLDPEARDVWQQVLEELGLAR